MFFGSGMAFLLLQQRLTCALEDPPPALAQAAKTSLNPLHTFRHPVRHIRQLGAMLDVRGSKRAHEEWRRRHDLS